MKKRIFGICLAVLCLLKPLPALAENEEAVTTQAASVELLELTTGQVLLSKNAQEERSPASITKIMTLLLIFEEIEKGNLSLDEEVITSAYAKSMGGSQVFLEEGEKQTVETLIKCIVVASGNDASVAMAEHIAGSEEQFVIKMNEKAKELGMEHTHFVDCCGLTDSTDHYTTAEDVAIMSRELVRKYPQILNSSSIWMESITHVTNQGTTEFVLTNTNKLIRSYEGCVGLKTGSTSTAKYCVSAVATRGDVTLLAVVLGAEESKQRFKDAAALLDYGFAICHLYTDDNEKAVGEIKVQGGVADTVEGVYKEPFYYLDTTGSFLDHITKDIRWQENIQAPLEQGDVIGQMVYQKDGEEIGSVDLIAADAVEKAGYGHYLKRAAQGLLLSA